MTAAALTLMSELPNPFWPWAETTTGLVVEAFPMGQLRAWDLPYMGYGKATGESICVRKRIVAGLRNRIDLGRTAGVLKGSPDALDAVLCAFAAIAVSEGRLWDTPIRPSADLEGWIPVHEV